ncbi:MAG: hypothetical protein J0G96_07185 [Flavobacteriia bacterium]|nr:hypothetical protein [Flavobacteriia bacterium]OJX36652.1 MAG: hypothetical protein BGO87_12695 [Flavobacteriia bacterium 40-80]
MDKLFPEYILKYGATGIMAVWLFTVNSRLSDVENRLYNCLETRVRVSESQFPDQIRPEFLALLPREERKSSNTKQQ